MASGSSFIITELSGERREVVLSGRGLPYRPFSLKTGQRVVLTRLPGSPVATSTVLGAREDPTNLRGMWKDRFFSGNDGEPPFKLNNRQIATVREAIDVLEKICQQGQQVRVSWMSIARVGFLTDFEAIWHNIHDVEWVMDFEWVSRGQAPGPAALIASVEASDAGSSLRSAFDSIDNITLPTLFGFVTPYTTALLNFVNGLQDLIFNLEDHVSNTIRKILLPVQAIRGMISIFKSIEDEASLLAGYMTAQVAGAMNGNRPVQDPGFSTDEDAPTVQTFADRMEAERYRREMLLWAAELKRIAADNRRQLEDQTSGELLGTYIAKANEDLRDVSKAYYNTPFEWRRLMVFNNLTSDILTAGQLVLIPKLSSDEDAQLTGGA